MKIYLVIGSDHGGLLLKNKLRKYYLKKKNSIDLIEDVGTYDTTSCDYPDIVELLVNKYFEINFSVLIEK